ncbi:hypothetical protein ACET3Z_027978 [Daucus carota]
MVPAKLLFEQIDQPDLFDGASPCISKFVKYLDSDECQSDELSIPWRLVHFNGNRLNETVKLRFRNGSPGALDVFIIGADFGEIDYPTVVHSRQDSTPQNYALLESIRVPSFFVIEVKPFHMLTYCYGVDIPVEFKRVTEMWGRNVEIRVYKGDIS